MYILSDNMNLLNINTVQIHRCHIVRQLRSASSGSGTKDTKTAHKWHPADSLYGGYREILLVIYIIYIYLLYIYIHNIVHNILLFYSVESGRIQAQIDITLKDPFQSCCVVLTGIYIYMSIYYTKNTKYI